MQRDGSTEINRERVSEAIRALREYQPLALQALEITMLLDRLAGIALDELDDIRGVNEAEVGFDVSQAIGHLQAVIDERRHIHAGLALNHVEQALRQLEPSGPGRSR